MQTDCPDHEESPKNRRRDAIRYTTAGGVGVTAVAVGFLLNGMQDLQADVRRLADAQQQQASAIERIQTSAAAYYAANESKHLEIAARVTAREQGADAMSRDIDALRRADQDLSARVTSVEQHQAGTAPRVSAERLAQIMDAVRRVDVADDAAWTTDSPRRPTTAALARIIGGPVSARERDLAFDLVTIRVDGG